LLDPLDGDNVAAGAFDTRAHGDQTLCKVHDLGLPRGVLDDRRTVGQRRRHHEVLRSGHRNEIHEDARALQPLRSRMDIASFETDFGAHRLETLNMEIDWT